MKYHPDVLAAHAEFGGDLQSMQALYDRPDHIVRIAALEAQLAEAKERNDRLHRRCQAAESLHQSVVGTLELWCGAVHKNHPEMALFSYAFQDMMKAKEKPEAIRSALEATPPAPKVTEEFSDLLAEKLAEWIWNAKGQPYLFERQLKSRRFTFHRINLRAAVAAALTAAQEAGKP